MAQALIVVDHGRVQGRSHPDRELLDAQALVGHLLPAGSVCAFLAEHRESVFPDGMFADLFPSGRGRPSVPGSVIASVLVLQGLQGLSDWEAMEPLRWVKGANSQFDCRGRRDFAGAVPDHGQLDG